MKRVAFLFVLASMLVPAFPVRAFDQAKAQSFLEAHANNPWSTMGLAALGSQSAPADYLKTISGSTANDYAAPILAITALGSDPRVFGGTDYVAKLKSYYTAGQIGDAATLNDDIFGLLALESAGELSSTEAQGAKDFILNHQAANGGWGFSASGGSDSNMTAASIVALIAGGASASDAAITKAFDYLKTAQNTDGGFTYDPQSIYGTASDSSSTAWVLWALKSAGIDQSSWSKGGKTPVEYLESTQSANGFFQYQLGSGEDAFSATTTGYAAIALSGKTLPLKVVPASGQGGGQQDLSKFNFRFEGQASGVCSGSAAGPTALDIVKNASSVCGFSYHIKDTAYGPYLDVIGADAASGTAGWLYAVNGTTPNVGADQYQLKSGDFVLWHFGNFDWQPTSGGAAASGGTSGAVQLSVNVTPAGQVQGQSIGFVVTPGLLSFGDVKAGTVAHKTVTLKNIGTSSLSVNAQVSGDSAFVDNLTLDNGAWKSFTKSLGAGTQSDVDASLNLPSNVSLGQKNGQLVFWATAQ